MQNILTIINLVLFISVSFYQNNLTAEAVLPANETKNP